MSTFLFYGKDRIYLGARAYLVEGEREVASEWAREHILHNPAHAWVLGKFVEAERANNNQQYFSLEGLRMGSPSIAHSPMNINHSSRNVVGAFVASELVYPISEVSDEQMNPYIESLGVFWKYYFPNEYKSVQRAHEEGSLFYSMECIPSALQTVGGSDDSAIYPYEGVNSPNYPDEINERSVAIHLVDPHFVGGALILPPNKPGWSRAESKVVANYMKEQWAEVESMYEQAGNTSENDGYTVGEWETLMGALVLMDYESQVARTFSTEERQRLAKNGQALPDGSFPIVTVEDLKNAIQAIGRAKNRSAAIAHIKKRARALGETGLLPEGW